MGVEYEPLQGKSGHVWHVSDSVFILFTHDCKSRLVYSPRRKKLKSSAWQQVFVDNDYTSLGRKTNGTLQQFHGRLSDYLSF